MGEALAVENSNIIPNTRNKIDIIEAFKLKFQHHLTYAEIADRFGVKAPSVHASLKRFLHILHNPEESAAYEQNRTQILTAVEFRLVNQLANRKKIKAASLNNIAYAVSQINNMVRLEKGQPTSITEQIDADLGGMIDQLCGLKSAGSGSTVDVSGNSDTPAASLSSSPDDDILSSLLPAIPADPGTFTPDQSTAPAADRSIQANLEASNLPVKLTKSGNARKPRTAKPSKSATNSRKQNTGKITSTLDSKVDTVKQGTNPTPAADTTSAAGKEWYD